MSTAPDPDVIYRRAEDEGRRRLSMPVLEQVATGFIAGVTIVFGIIALGVTESLVEPQGLAKLLGAVAFAIGVVFLVVGRSELFSENFFDPVAAAVAEDGAGVWGSLLKLWVATLVFNLIGGAIMVALVTVPGALPGGAPHVLVTTAEELAHKGWQATLVRAVLAGALIALLSYMLSGSDSVAARIVVSLLAGFFLALGPFDHVVVSVLHLLYGVIESDKVGWGDLGTNLGLAAVGNVVGGLSLITLTHSAQVKASRS